jgi:Na+-driven multidrug efflux pump
VCFKKKKKKKKKTISVIPMGDGPRSQKKPSPPPPPPPPPQITCEISTPPLFSRRHLGEWLSLSVPVALNFLSRGSMAITDLAVVGRLGTVELGAAGLGVLLCTVTTVPLTSGPSAALKVLGAQAYGARAYALVGTWFRIALWVSLLACTPVLLVWVFAAHRLFAACGFELEMSRLAGQFCAYSALWLVPFTVYQTLIGFQQSQSRVTAQLVISVTWAMLNVPFNIILVHGFAPAGFAGLGFIGSPIATACARTGMVLCLIAVVAYQDRRAAREARASSSSSSSSSLPPSSSLLSSSPSPSSLSPPPSPPSSSPHGALPQHHTGSMSRGAAAAFVGARVADDHDPTSTSTAQMTLQQTLNAPLLMDAQDPALLLGSLPAKTTPRCWVAWSTDCLDAARVRTFAAQAVPLGLGSTLEEFQLQLISGFASKLGPLAIAAHSSSMETFFVLTSFEWAAMQATSTMVGQKLGAGLPGEARAIGRMGLVISAVVGLVVAGALFALRNEVGKVFSHDPEVHHLMAKVTYLVSGGYTLLALFYNGMAILQAQGRPVPVMISFLVGAWFVAVPLAYVLAYTVSMGLIGLWIGMTAGYAVVTVICSFFVLRSDWPALARDAQARAEQNNSEKNNSEKNNTNNNNNKNNNNSNNNKNDRVKGKSSLADEHTPLVPAV